MLDNLEDLSKKPSILEFFRVLFGDWFSGMSGGISIPFAFLGIHALGSQKDLFYILAIVALSITTWRLWTKERLKVCKLENSKKFGPEKISIKTKDSSNEKLSKAAEAILSQCAKKDILEFSDKIMLKSSLRIAKWNTPWPSTSCG